MAATPPAAPPAIIPLDRMRRLELERLTEDNGFGLPQGEAAGWARFTGLALPYPLHVARSAAGTWLVGMAHAGVMKAIATDDPLDMVTRPDGGAAVVVADLGPAIRRMAALARSLPTAPLDSFVARTRALPRATEAERLVIRRVGQDIFRQGLLDYWQGRCAVTGLAVPALLRASHAKPWARCASDAERLDVFNGLLLAAHLDAAFDAGLIAVAEDGAVIVAAALDASARVILGLDAPRRVERLAAEHRPYLAWHRAALTERAKLAAVP